MSRSTDDLDLAGDPTLAALVADVRATRPPRDPAASRALDARVASGFARPSAAARPRRRRGLAWLAAVPACLAVLAAVAIVVSSGSGGEGGVAGSASSSGSAAGSSAGAVAPSSRLVARDATLELRTSPRELQADADAVVATTERAGGYVASSRVDAGAAGGSATFVLQVPTDRLARTLTQLGRVARVSRLDQGSEDVTAQASAGAARLTDAREERDALLRALADATDRGRVAALRARLEDARALVARRTRQLGEVRARARTARVDVSLTAVASGAAVAPARGDGRLTPAEALATAGRVLGAAGAVALLAALLLAPLALVGAGGALGLRRLRRRAREGALRAA